MKIRHYLLETIHTDMGIRIIGFLRDLRRDHGLYRAIPDQRD